MLNDIKELVSFRTGLRFYGVDADEFDKTLFSRIGELGLESAERYCALLDSNGQGAVEEWQKLIALLTTGETYFLRDLGQMEVLRKRLLPKLIKNRSGRRPLRIWSAGCSTGEEPYSIAILIKELTRTEPLPEIEIVGTDINKEALSKADKGIYGEWSFRGIAPDFMERYFKKEKKGWRIDDSIREMVSFSEKSLSHLDYPSYASGLHDMDLILCRNVLIYLKREVVPGIIERLLKSLRGDGYLMVGHSEILSGNYGGLKPCLFPESIVYSHTDGTETTASKPLPATDRIRVIKRLPVKARFSRSSASKRPAPRALVKAASSTVTMNGLRRLFNRASYGEAVRAAKALLTEIPRDFDLLHLLARAYANMGEYGEALVTAARASNVKPLSIDIYFLMAHIHQELGNRAETREMLRKILYLSPLSVAAYLELAALDESDNEREKARTIRTKALEILKELPEGVEVAQYGGVTAGELIEHIAHTSCMRNRNSGLY